MEWTRSETLALAKDKCTICDGLGLQSSRKDVKVCDCVLRGIFRVCYNRFRDCAAGDPSASALSMERGLHRDANGAFGRKQEEYAADFCLVAKRTLTASEHKIFRYHFLLGADYKLCCRKLGMDKGLFFHHVYRIQQKLGAAFRNLAPYPLFPLSDYFGGPMREHKAIIVEMKPKSAPLQAWPWKQAA